MSFVEYAPNKFFDTSRVVRAEPSNGPGFSLAVVLDDDYQTVLLFSGQEALVIAAGLRNETIYDYRRDQEKEKLESPLKPSYKYFYQWTGASGDINSVSLDNLRFRPIDENAALAEAPGADRSDDEDGAGEEADESDL